MADEGGSSGDAKFDYVKSRIASAFPKIAGAKLDKLIAADEAREVLAQFFDDEYNRCLVVPETVKLEKIIPSKLSKGKLLVFIKLHPCVLSEKNIASSVSISFNYFIFLIAFFI
jgi:hypothetical protein